MPTNDDGKLNRPGHTTPHEPDAADEPRAARPAAPARSRGPYKISDEEVLNDPQVAAFKNALRQIADPKKRASLEWLVYELARCKSNRR